MDLDVCELQKETKETTISMGFWEGLFRDDKTFRGNLKERHSGPGSCDN